MKSLTRWDPDMKEAEKTLVDAGLEETFWGTRIIEAEKRGDFSQGQTGLAGVWTTCACGKQDERMPREKQTGAPVDGILRALGSTFYADVWQNDFADAAKTLVKIEERAAQILDWMQLTAEGV